MDMVHGPGQDLDEPRRLAGRLRHPVELSFEAAALHQLQREEGPPLPLAHLVDLNDVRMLQAGDGLGLDPEPGPLVRTGVRAGQDHLEGHRAIEPDLAGPIDDPHAARAPARPAIS